MNRAVIGLQWGDEGKGKIVDRLSANCSAVVRFSGGSNAGHTVVIDTHRYVFHLLPSGAASGKKLILASGVAVDPQILQDEIDKLSNHEKIVVDCRCNVVTPFDKRLDVVLEEMKGRSALGTTRRGIGPSYAMKALRFSPRVCDLLFSDFDFDASLVLYKALGIDVREGLGAWVENAKLTLGGIAGNAGKCVEEMNEKGEEVIFEGSQGSLLDIVHGSYPYVTSSHTLSTYIPVSLGLNSNVVGKVIGVMKCYTTRVGAGPFPSEENGMVGGEIRNEGREYGATTGRPRRIGWLDVVSLRYAARMNGVDELAITKLDVLSKFKDFKICRSYVHNGMEITDFFKALPILDEVKAVTEEIEGIYRYDFASGVNGGLGKFIELIENELKIPIRIVSYGEERKQTIEL